MQMDGKRAIVRARLGKRIHDLREAQSVSQYQFCEMVRMDRSYLIGVEKGRKNISIDKYITNRQWDKYGEEKLFKAGDKVSFNIDVINTGTEDIGKIVVYDVLKGAKIKKGSGYKVDSDGDAIIKDLASSSGSMPPTP